MEVKRICAAYWSATGNTDKTVNTIAETLAEKLGRQISEGRAPVEAIREAMDRLNEREQRILNLRFFQGRTQMEVAGEIGISQAQVSRLEKAALSHMRKLV